MQKRLSTPAALSVSLLALLVSGQARATLFTEGDELTLTYKNVYFNESADAIDQRIWGAERDEWVHALFADYKSGYLGDWLQLEFGLAGVEDIHIGSRADNVTNLPGATAANGFKPDTLFGTQTAYISTRYRGEGFSLHAGAGKKARQSAIYQDSLARIQPATSVGFDLAADLGALRLYYTELYKMSQRDADNWGESLRTYSGARVDALRYYGGDYDFGNGLKLALAQAESESYIKERKARISYLHPLAHRHALQLQATYGTMQDNGGLYERNGVALGTINGEDYALAEAGPLDARYYELSAGYRWPDYSLTLNYSRVTGGDWNHNLVANEFRLWDTSSQYAWIWYGLEDEAALSLLGSADFTPLGLPGLSWNGGVWYSDQARGYTGFERYELTNMLSYRFSGALEGLSLSWLNSYHRSQGELDQVTRTAHPVGPAMLERKDVNRLYLTWTRVF